MTSHALVLGAGGVSGIGWEIGVLHGLRKGGALTAALDLVVGTSGGACAAVQLLSGKPLGELYAAQVDESAATAERSVPYDDVALMRTLARARRDASSPAEARALVGAIALRAETLSENERMSIIESRLPVGAWPETILLVPAVDAESGESVLFDRSSGIELKHAVAASCAVPGVWPPATIGTRRYIDGSVRSNANADLAEGMDRVLVVTPSAGVGGAIGLRRQVAALEAGASVTVVTADEASIEAMGHNRLDPVHRAASAREGLRQGEAIAAVVMERFG